MCCRKLCMSLLVLAIAPAGWSQNSEQIRVVGVGSTLPLPVYSRLFPAFEEAHPEIRTSYLPYGSSRAVEMVAAGTADFGASDAPTSERPLARKVLYFPTFVAAVVPIYNLPGITEPLRFTARALTAGAQSQANVNRLLSLPAKSFGV